ncbi:MAG: sugar kinase [Spirochaetes bacterium]|nr:MAG: sugar kinase [Spirochaetota bacterium]
MLLLIGTLPIEGLKLHTGEATLDNGKLKIGDKRFAVIRGTPAMMAACCAICNAYNLDNPYCIVAGDIGAGDGSSSIYNYLKDNLYLLEPEVCAFHYIKPVLVAHNKVVDAINKMNKKPILIADAGYMYVAKMAGFASFYDIFTPDLGELAFLADKESPHPFYTRGFIFHMEDKAEELIEMAYKEKNAPKVLCVKGKKDYISKDGKIVKIITKPDIPVLEAIGGTGDTITGMVAAFTYKGLSLENASIISAKLNRIAGKLTNPTPATQIVDIIERIPLSIEKF